MTNHPNRSRSGQYAIVVLRSNVPEGLHGHAKGIRTAGNKLVTFHTVDAALAYLPRYVAWVKDGYRHDKDWSRYNRRRDSEVFLVVSAADVHPFGIVCPHAVEARVEHSEYN